MQKTLANTQMSTIKEQLEHLQQRTSLIHVSIHNKRNRIVDAPSKIIGIYPRFLCVESKVNEYVERFTINYTDLMIGNISIKEL